MLTASGLMMRGLASIRASAAVVPRPALARRTLSAVVFASATTDAPAQTQKKAVSSNIKEGELVQGTVSNVTAYGVFVTLSDGSQALLHRSQLSKQKVEDVAALNLFKQGDKITALVYKIASGRTADAAARINLSTRAIEPERGQILQDPSAIFNNAEANLKARNARRAELVQIRKQLIGNYKVGQVVEGVIEVQQKPFAMVNVNGLTLKLSVSCMPDNSRPDTKSAVKVLITSLDPSAGQGEVTMRFKDNGDGTGTAEPPRGARPRAYQSSSGSGEQQRRPRRTSAPKVEGEAKPRAPRAPRKEKEAAAAAAPATA